MGFAEKVVLVTGAGGGLGGAVALRFAAQGANVISLDIDEGRAERTAQEIRARGGAAHAFGLDVTSMADAERLALQVQQQFGDVHCLANIAGRGYEGTVLTMTYAQWRDCLEVNLSSAFVMSKAFWAALIAKPGASIINTSSVMGVVGGAGSIAYCTAKAALLMFTRCLAKDGARFGLRVNCVSPGYIETGPMLEHIGRQSDPEAFRRKVAEDIPVGRMASAEEIADLYLFLASEQSRYVTGASMLADGGLSSAWFKDESQ